MSITWIAYCAPVGQPANVPPFTPWQNWVVVVIFEPSGGYSVVFRPRSS
jgi:hypothetical protein